MKTKLRRWLLGAFAVVLVLGTGPAPAQNSDLPCRYLWLDRDAACVSLCDLRKYKCPCQECLL